MENFKAKIQTANFVSLTMVPSKGQILRLEKRDPQNEFVGRISNRIFAEVLFLNVLLLIKTMLVRNISLANAREEKLYYGTKQIFATCGVVK